MTVFQQSITGTSGFTQIAASLPRTLGCKQLVLSSSIAARVRIGPSGGPFLADFFLAAGIPLVLPPTGDCWFTAQAETQLGVDITAAASVTVAILAGFEPA